MRFFDYFFFFAIGLFIVAMSIAALCPGRMRNYEEEKRRSFYRQCAIGDTSGMGRDRAVECMVYLFWVSQQEKK